MKIANNFIGYFLDSIKTDKSVEDVIYSSRILMANQIFKYCTIKKLKSILATVEYQRKLFLGNTLLAIINNSLETSQTSENWKKSMVIPIEKVAKTKNLQDSKLSTEKF